MRKRPVPRSMLLLRLALVVGAFAFQACDVEGSRPTRAPQLTLEIAGVVESQQTGVEGSRGYADIKLDDGRTYRLYTDAAGPGWAVGDLLFSGTKPWLWVDTAQLRDPRSWPAGCYGYQKNGYERTSTVELDNGLTLDKAPNYAPLIVHQDNRLWGETLCLDKQARVFEIVG